jgi:very-short-patch-repair endonuclease
MTSLNRRAETVGSRLAWDEPLPRIAARQAGVFTARQAAQEGWTRSRIRKRLQAGLWVPVIGRGITAAGREISATQLGWATYLTVPRDESRWTSDVVSHLTAGAIFGFPLVGPVGGHIIANLHRSPAGIRVHRDQLSNSEVVQIGGLPLTTRRRTALDCLALLNWDAAVNLWAWLLTRRILTAELLGVAVRDRLGRRGTPTLVRLMSLACSGAASIAELRFHRLLRAAGLSGWQPNVPVSDAAGLIAVVDVLFPAVRLVIEVDGFNAHRSRESFVRDRRREWRLTEAGYITLHVTWDELRDDPERVLAHVRAALLRLTVSPSPQSPTLTS